jgi:hypothetical protein
MDIQINVSPEQITKVVSQAILDSTLGNNIKKIIEEKVAELGKKDWNEPIRKAIENEIFSVIEKFIIKEYKPQIEEIVRKQISETYAVELVEKLLARIVDKAKSSW